MSFRLIMWSNEGTRGPLMSLSFLRHLSHPSKSHSSIRIMSVGYTIHPGHDSEIPFRVFFCPVCPDTLSSLFVVVYVYSDPPLATIPHPPPGTSPCPKEFVHSKSFCENNPSSTPSRIKPLPLSHTGKGFYFPYPSLKKNLLPFYKVC